MQRYRRVWSNFIAFRDRGTAEEQADPSQAAEAFILEEMADGKSANMIAASAAAISHHMLSEQPPHDMSSPRWKKFIKGAKAVTKHRIRPNPKNAFTQQHITMLLTQALKSESLIRLRVAAAVGLAFAGYMRISEVHGLQAKHIQRTNSGWKLSLIHI